MFKISYKETFNLLDRIAINQKILNQAIDKFVSQGISPEKALRSVHQFNNLVLKNKIVGQNIQQLSYEELENLISESEPTNTYQTPSLADIEIIFENNFISVYLIKSLEASCFYGFKTRWCVTDEDGDSFDEYSKDYNIYFIIPKNDDNKISVLIDKSGNIHSVWNHKNHLKDLEWLNSKLNQYQTSIKEIPFKAKI